MRKGFNTLPFFIHWVQAVTILGGTVHNEEHMSYLRQTLALIAYGGDPAASLDDNTRIRSSQVRVLHVNSLRLQSWPDLERIILAFPKVTDLRAVEVHYKRKHEHNEDAHTRSLALPTLTRCSVYGADAFETLSNLFSPRDVVHLRALELEVETAYSSWGISLTRRAGRHLTELSLILRTMCE